MRLSGTKSRPWCSPERRLMPGPTISRRSCRHAGDGSFPTWATSISIALTNIARSSSVLAASSFRMPVGRSGNQRTSARRAGRRLARPCIFSLYSLVAIRLTDKVGADAVYFPWTSGQRRTRAARGPARQDRIQLRALEARPRVRRQQADRWSVATETVRNDDRQGRPRRRRGAVAATVAQPRGHPSDSYASGSGRHKTTAISYSACRNASRSASSLRVSPM